jgi:cold shock CspA family protein
MRGVVKFYLPARHFGFICFSSQPGSNRLDRSIHFYDTELSGYVDQGQRVEFEIDTKDEKEEAISITPIDDRFSGTVVTTGRKAYCFINVDDRLGEDGRIFCAFANVEPDVIGRRALSVGTRVSFRIEVNGDGLGECAVDVRSEDPSLATIDAEHYREFGSVEYYDGDRGHIRRSCGDTLTFLKKNVVTEGVDTIAPGTWLQYAITRHNFLFSEEHQQFRHRVFARDIAVCLGSSNDLGSDSEPILPVEFVAPDSVEAHFLQADQADQLPITVGEPERLSAGQIYTASERKLTLRELIERRALAPQ